MKVLSRVFRNKYRALLQKAFQRGELEFFGELQPLADARAFQRYLDAATGGSGWSMPSGLSTMRLAS